VATVALDYARDGKPVSYLVRTRGVDEGLHLRKVDGARWDPRRGVWVLPLDTDLGALRRRVALVFENGAGEWYEQRVTRLEELRRLHTAKDADVRFGEGLDGYQRVGVKFLATAGSAILADDLGLGKGHPIGTHILTPRGWRPIEQLRVGDKVIGANGQPTTVVGVYWRGVLPVFRVTFTDGASVLVDADHLWAVRTVNDQRRGLPFRVVSTRQLIGDLRWAYGQLKWRIPLVKPVEFESDTNYPIDPYILGVWLADGSVGHSVKFVPGDERVAEEVRKLLPPGLSLARRVYKRKASEFVIASAHAGAPNPVFRVLKNLGLTGLRSYERFIPESYLLAPVGVRLALLQGLMDSDGEVRKHDGHVEYVTTSKALAEGVAFLVQSLGGTVRWHEKKAPAYIHNGEKRQGKLAYRLTIAMPDGLVPFRVRADEYRPHIKYKPNRIIESIEPAGEAEVVCIAVDAPDRLYVTEHFIVTHNTAQAIRACLEVGARRVLVVTKKSLLAQWEKEIEKWANGEFARLAASSGTISGAPWTVANYEAVVRHADRLASVGFDAMIVDEATAVKNRKAQRSKAIHKLAKVIPHRFLLTGTPIHNRPDELWSLLHTVSPTRFTSYWRWVEEHCETWPNPWGGVDILGVKNPKKLSEAIYPYLLRRTKELLNLPPLSEETVHIDLTDEQRRIYRELKTLLMSSIGSRIVVTPTVLSQLTRLRQVCCSPALLGGKDASAKTEALLDLLEEYAPDHKVLVFTTFAEYVRLLLPVLRQWNPAYITGDLSAAQREAQVARFRDDPTCRVLVGTITAMGEGLNLQVADVVVFLNREWVPAWNEQAVGRAYRRGQTKPVHVVNLVCRNTVEERVERLLAAKENVVREVDLAVRLLAELKTDLTEEE